MFDLIKCEWSDQHNFYCDSRWNHSAVNVETTSSMKYFIFGGSELDY